MTTKEKEKQLEILRNSYLMYEKSKVDTKKKRNDMKDKFGVKIYSDEDTKKALELIDTMQADVRDQYIKLNGSDEGLKTVKKVTKGNDRKDIITTMKYLEMMEGNKEQEEKENTQDIKVTTKEEDISIFDRQEDNIFSSKKEDTNDIFVNYADKSNGNRVQYDNVPLPSKGQCYKDKFDKVPVGYLTAYDENLIVSPNLYNDGTFLDHLIRSKVMNSKINTDDLLPGDRDAIILWLRATSYGPEFPVIATDNETGKQFDATVDLTKIKYKKFDLVGDEDGYFDYELPFSKDKVKFKFLTYKDTQKLEKLDIVENNAVIKDTAEKAIDKLSEIIENDEEVGKELKAKATRAIETLTDFKNNLSDKASEYTHAITNKLILSIVSVNDITDRRYINDYVVNMNVRDAASLRKYINDNEPGLDFNIEVERPESLGGGSVRMFLTFDQYLFLNVII